MHTRAERRRRKFREISPDQIQAGDILHCFLHDNQHEWRAMKVTSALYVGIPGILSGPYWRHKDAEPELMVFPYEYSVQLTLRHIDIHRPDASGGDEFSWTALPWNSVWRYEMESTEGEA